MIGTDRSYEHRSYAVNRAHLQRVSVPVEPWWHSLLLWVAIIAVLASVYRVLP